MQETNKDVKKKHGYFSFISGLILLIIAVGLVLVKNGVNLFGKGDTPEQLFIKANLGLCDKINEELLEYMAYCGTNARDNDGHLKSETVINTEKKLNAPEDSLLGSLIGMIGLDKLSITEEYSAKNEDGLITVVRQSDGQTVYSKETLLYGLDFSKLGKSSALKEKTIKKLLNHYEKLFFNELLKDGYEYSKDVLINIDNVMLAENGFAIDYSNEDIRKALEAVIDDIASDKKWKKAYESMNGGDFKEFTDKLKESAFGEKSFLKDIHGIKGTIYVRNSGDLNYAELTFDVDDKAIEERITKNGSWLLSNAVDVDPVFTLSVGYTAQADTRGFKFSVVNADNEVRIDLTGHGTQNKTGIFDGKVSGFTGSAELLYKGQKGTLTLTDAQIIDMKKGVRLNGVFAITLDKTGIAIAAEATNTEQNIKYDMNLNGKSYMSGKVDFRDK